MSAVTASGRRRDVSRLYRFDDGVEVVVPIAASTRRFGVVTAGAMPTHWGTGGLVSTGPVSPRNAALVLSDLAGMNIGRLTIWPDARQHAVWEAGRSRITHTIVAVPRRFHVLELTPGFDAITRTGFDKYTRRYLKRADEAGVTTTHDRTGRLIPEFFDVLQRAIPRWAGQQHEPVGIARFRAARRDPIEKFETICRHMGDQAVIGIARVDGRAVAAVLYLLGRNADIIWAPVDPDIGASVHAPTKLYAEAIRAACDAGCTHFSMGESGFAAGLDRFKRRLGARAVDYCSYRIEHLPLTPVEETAKRVVKRVIGFRDTAAVS